MTLTFDAVTDSLYIDFRSEASTDAREITDGVVVDFDASGRIVGIDIQHASERLDLETVEADGLKLAPAS